MCELAATLMEAGKLAQAARVLSEAKSLAASLGRRLRRARLLVETPGARAPARGARRDKGGARDHAAGHPDVLERADDQRGLSRAWQLQASSDWRRGQVSDAADGLGGARRARAEAAGRARVGGDQRLDRLRRVARRDARRRRHRPLRADPHEVTGHPACEVEVLRPLGGLHGFAGRFELAQLAVRGRGTRSLDDVGRGLTRLLAHRVVVEMLAGDDAAAERCCAGRTRRSRRGGRAPSAPRDGPARPGARRAGAARRRGELRGPAAALAEPDDLMTQILWRTAQRATSTRRAATSTRPSAWRARRRRWAPSNGLPELPRRCARRPRGGARHRRTDDRDIADRRRGDPPLRAEGKHRRRGLPPART